MQEKILNMNNKVLINEIFESIQGEGLYVGVNQLFIRFTQCNLNCNYCDTDYVTKKREYEVNELTDIINGYRNIHSVSLTGAEPLMETEFLVNLLPKIRHTIYLETNGTLYQNLEKVINNVDIISMDIKLPSSTKGNDLFIEHEKFIEVAASGNKEAEIFLKLVFDKEVTQEEIKKSCKLAEKYGLILILQPKMEGNKLADESRFINETFYNFNKLYSNTRLIPQMHKFLDIK